MDLKLLKKGSPVALKLPEDIRQMREKQAEEQLDLMNKDVNNENIVQTPSSVVKEVRIC